MPNDVNKDIKRIEQSQRILGKTEFGFAYPYELISIRERSVLNDLDIPWSFIYEACGVYYIIL